MILTFAAACPECGADATWAASYSSVLGQADVGPTYEINHYLEIP